MFYQHGKVITREELEKILANEKNEVVEVIPRKEITYFCEISILLDVFCCLLLHLRISFLQQMAEIDDAMAQAVDIGENDVRFLSHTFWTSLYLDFAVYCHSLRVENYTRWLRF